MSHLQVRGSFQKIGILSCQEERNPGVSLSAGRPGFRREMTVFRNQGSSGGGLMVWWGPSESHREVRLVQSGDSYAREECLSGSFILERSPSLELLPGSRVQRCVPGIPRSPQL